MECLYDYLVVVLPLKMGKPNELFIFYTIKDVNHISLIQASLPPNFWIYGLHLPHHYHLPTP